MARIKNQEQACLQQNVLNLKRIHEEPDKQENVPVKVDLQTMEEKDGSERQELLDILADWVLSMLEWSVLGRQLAACSDRDGQLHIV
eukprot:1920590-Amphidinium_carterae.1